MACYCGDCASHQVTRTGPAEAANPGPTVFNFTDPFEDVDNGIDYSDFSGLIGTCEIGEVDPDFDLNGRRVYEVATQDGKGIVIDAAIEDAVVVGSKVVSDLHKPVIDIDVPVRYVESTQEGHGHLYIDHVVEFDKYVKILEALRDAGIVEWGYVEGVKARGAGYVRLPWVRKSGV